jgi:hypothetical protein
MGIVHQLFIDWVMSEVWYNVLTEFDTPINLYPGTHICDHRSRGNILELLEVCSLHFIESQSVVGWNEIRSKVLGGKHLCDVLTVQNSLQKEDASLPLIFTFAVGVTGK